MSCAFSSYFALILRACSITCGGRGFCETSFSSVMLLVKPRVPPIEQNGLPTGQIELTSAQAGGTQCPLPLREESAERCQYYGEALVGFGSNHPNLGFIMEFMSAVVCKTKYTNALTAKWIPLEVVDTGGTTMPHRLFISCHLLAT